MRENIVGIFPTQEPKRRIDTISAIRTVRGKADFGTKMRDIKVKRGIHSPRQSPAAVLKAFCGSSSVSRAQWGFLFSILS